jgi:hypothetical protein
MPCGISGDKNLPNLHGRFLASFGMLVQGYFPKIRKSKTHVPLRLLGVYLMFKRV